MRVSTNMADTETAVPGALGALLVDERTESKCPWFVAV